MLVTYYPDHMQDPSSGAGKDRAASLRTAGACQNTAVPSGNLRVDSRGFPVVFRKRHTWAAPGNWPWGSAGLWDGNVLGCEDRIPFSLSLSAHRHGSHHQTVSSPSAVSSGRGNSRSTWSSTPWWRWWPQTGGWRRRCQLWWLGWGGDGGGHARFTLSNMVCTRQLYQMINNPGQEITPKRYRYGWHWNI